MSVGFVLAFSAMAFAAHDIVLVACALIGVLSSGGRIAVLIHGRRESAAPHLDVYEARLLEQRFSIAYYQFAAILGASAAYVFTLEPARFHMLTVCLLVGYGAGRQRASDYVQGSRSPA